MSNPFLDELSPEEKQAFLRDLAEAYYSGASRVRFRERDVTYRSMDEMKAVLDELTTAVRGKRRKHVIFTTFSRGR
ncbi:hypothetical protein J2045_003347 [Peteryoungia aggregata LMG 23059]|uniref:Uncharacterized protein n=1 Tax=Peteryoungia aggregata LMG 23059 TaxID=1368425 RepID=A0ABU0GAB5_9HYPH|nr:hypothetical protein [Peteryoungia aggregata]MDQ0422299.1 hypothetical protein [Peteryoungia aggregata LMG 23059]